MVTRVYLYALCFECARFFAYAPSRHDVLSMATFQERKLPPVKENRRARSMDVSPIAITNSKGTMIFLAKLGGRGSTTKCANSCASASANDHVFSDIDIGNLIEDASAKDDDNGGGEQLEPVLEQLATHVPDLIVFRSHDAPLPQTIHSYGVVMFTDISGKLPRVGTMETMFTLYCLTFSLHCRIHSFV